MATIFLLKAKAAQIGDIRNRKSGMFQKKSDGKWVQIQKQGKKPKKPLVVKISKEKPSSVGKVIGIFKRLKTLMDQEKKIEKESDSPLKTFIDKKQTDFAGRIVTDRHQIEQLSGTASAYKKYPNYAMPDKNELTKERDKISKRKRASAKSRDRLKKLNEFISNYESELKSRKSLVSAFEKRDKISNKLDPIKDKMSKLQDQANSIYKKLPDKSKKNMMKLKDKIIFGTS